MKTYLDCVPCLIRQALNAARTATDDEKKIKEILDYAGDSIKNFELESTPVELAEGIYKNVREVTGVYDPFKRIKEDNINEAIFLFPQVNEILNKSNNRLLTAVRIAIAGNVIDLGVDKKFNIIKDLQKIMKQDFAISDFKYFEEKVNRAKNVL